MYQIFLLYFAPTDAKYNIPSGDSSCLNLNYNKLQDSICKLGLGIKFLVPHI